ncbi:MAG: TSUP family transporter [Erysipelotrichaceae bacterium]|jgi:uncharacterized membrane protein YfcA
MGVDILIIVLVSFLSSVAGSICGIGGGMVIKPVLDSIALFDLATVNFLSGCTVLTMSSFNVISSFIKKENTIEIRNSSLLAFSSIWGGLSGKYFFELFQNYFTNQSYASAIQSLILLLINLSSLIYTLNKDKISTLKITSTFYIVVIGFLLGFMSSFLGIGGGPINIIILQHFFSMSNKTAAQNSLYIIFFSQLASLVPSFFTGNFTDVPLPVFYCMTGCGLSGALAGKYISRKISGKNVNTLFISLMIFLVLLNIYNFITFIS